MKQPSDEALAAATKYIDKQIANAVQYGSRPPDALTRLTAIWETAQLTDKWMSLPAVESLTRTYDDGMKSAGCAQCGGPLPYDRKYVHFCSERCQKVMDTYIAARIKRRPHLTARSQTPRSSTHSPT